MNLKKVKYMFKQAAQSIWRNRMMGLASIGSVTAVLIILGFILLIVLNINNIAMVTKEKFDEIAIYVEEGLDNEIISKMGQDFGKIDGVLTVKFQTKDYALEEMKDQWGDDASLLDGLRNNPLPNTYVIQLEDIKYADYVMQELRGYEGIEDIRYYNEAVKTLTSISDFIKKSGAILIVILLFISIFIISNTIKITVLNRRKEIELMQYIGATNGYVRGPFIIEGVTLGLIGAFIATLVVMLGYDYSLNFIAGKYFALLAGFSNYLISIDTILSDIIIIFFTIGTGIGILGSLISLKKFLSV